MSEPGGGPVVPRQPCGPSAMGKYYLIAYNFVMAVLWGGLLFVVVEQAAKGASPEEINAAASPFARGRMHGPMRHACMQCMQRRGHCNAGGGAQ